jgi:hypothetical protein
MDSIIEFDDEDSSPSKLDNKKAKSAMKELRELMNKRTHLMF